MKRGASGWRSVLMVTASLAAAACGFDPTLSDDTCHDGAKTAGEGDVDCGGTCAPCIDGKACNSGDDCTSRSCSAGTCVAPTCSDGVRDGYESDADCGGICGACASGKVCAADTDCTSAACDNGIGTTGTCQP